MVGPRLQKKGLRREHLSERHVVAAAACRSCRDYACFTHCCGQRKFLLSWPPEMAMRPPWPALPVRPAQLLINWVRKKPLCAAARRQERNSGEKATFDFFGRGSPHGLDPARRRARETFGDIDCGADWLRVPRRKTARRFIFSHHVPIDTSCLFCVRVFLSKERIRCFTLAPRS